MIEEANGGTLFLDEIGDISHPSQVKLLRLLQEGEYFQIGSDTPRKLKAKLIFATNHNLGCNVEKGMFRRDLFYRLSAHDVRIPPLRQRLDDLPLLIIDFLEEAARSMGKKTPTAPKELAILLSNYSFPGNIRELRAMIFDAVSQHKSHILSLDLFKNKIGFTGFEPLETSSTKESVNVTENSAKVTFPDRLPNLDELYSEVVNEAMLRSQGNQTLAAAMLGITRQGLAKRLKKLSAAGESL